MGAVKPQKLSVSKIKSRLLNIAQSSLYRLTLQVPAEVQNKLKGSLSSFDYENINLLCCEATLPGSSLTTHEVNNDYHGVTEKMAYRRMYDETLGLTFYVDRDYKVIEMIEGWMDYISGVNDKQQYKGEYIGYRMSYPKSYKNNIYLTKFEKDHFIRDFSSTLGTSTRTARSMLEYTFVNAFPLSLTAIPVSYEQGEVLKCNVSFNFIRYVQEKKSDSFSIESMSDRVPPINRDPTRGMNDQLRTIGTRSATT
tara:strand:+ start:42 stop:800 length:759 start_codon:yes stop_codon:yes gene_type:complete